MNEINNIPEKEQSLVLNFENLQQGQMIRTGKQVSPRGDDYTFYRELSWYFYNPSQRTADLDLFFRVGSDSLNFYEVAYNFAGAAGKTGWHQLTVNLAELSNVKNGEIDQEGVAHAEIVDARTGDVYQARVVGRPDLRHVKRYYFGVMNRTLSDGADGYFYFNDVRLEDVKKDMGMAQRAGVRVNMADILKVDYDWKHTDDEFHGLDKRSGSGIDYRDWNLATNFKIDDFIPLLGFQLPVNLSRRQTTNRPKYVTNSDIEILDEETAVAMSTIDKQERFSTRLSHRQSTNTLARYLVDPWTLLLNGSRTAKDGPLEIRRQKSLQGSLTYDLRINGRYTLSEYPLLGAVPVLRGLSLVPRKITLGASFTSSRTSSISIDDDGNMTTRPDVVTRPGSLSASVDYKPATILDLTVNAKSDRDLLREQRSLGVNIGQENKRSYDLRMTISAPMVKDIAPGAFMAPVRAFARLSTHFRPSLQFTGGFVDQHDPGVRQAGDDENVRSISNNGNWDLRFEVPVGETVKKLLPERKITDAERQRLIEQQRRLEQRALAGGGGPGGREEDLSGLTPEERRRREEERLLEEARQREQQEQEEGLTAKPEAEPAAPGGRINPLAILDPFLDIVRGSSPVKVTLSRKRNSSYSRLEDTAPFWYQTGLDNSLDVPDSAYATMSFQDRKDVNLTTNTKVNRNISLDVKYSRSTSLRDQVGTRTRNLQNTWPDLSVSLSGIEKWGVFKGDPKDPNAGWFRSSNLNFTYKRTKTVNNYTETFYNPTINTTIAPRWSFTFHSGLSANLNSTITSNDALANGVMTKTRKMRIGLQFKHQFKAQKLLAKLGLYRPGNNPVVSLDVDLNYQRDRTERINPGSQATAPTGQIRYSIAPRFSYQISRSLNGAFRMSFSKSRDVATDRTTTSLGIGVEATFVF